jgi:itaconate CoA-transferase
MAPGALLAWVKQVALAEPDSRELSCEPNCDRVVRILQHTRLMRYPDTIDIAVFPAGEGATLDITMLEALGEWMGFPAYFSACGGTPPPRSGAYHATIVPYGPFRAGDGGTVFLSVQNEREFEQFCGMVLGNAALASDARFSSSPARLQNREALHAEIEKQFKQLKTDEVIERLEKADIANARMNDMQGFWSHPQFEARGRWVEVDSPAGKIPALKPPFNFQAMEPVMGAVPAEGQHTRAVLAEIGYDDDAIRRLTGRPRAG